MNGLIVDDEPIHFRLLRDVLAEEGIDLNWSVYTQKYLAYDDKDCFRLTFENAGKRITPEKIKGLIKRKSDLYEKEKHTVGLFPGVAEFVKDSHHAGAKLAVASGALLNEISFLMEQAGLRNYFDAIVGAEDVDRGKPDPEIFLKALSRLNEKGGGNIQPKEAIVLEDSIHGVMAANEAGIPCLAITNSYPKEKLTHAQWVLPTLKGIRFVNVKKLHESRKS